MSRPSQGGKVTRSTGRPTERTAHVAALRTGESRLLGGKLRVSTRPIRGFAVKFYTDEGNWDLVGNNTPTFFIRDPLKFTDLNHVVMRDPRTNLNNPRNNWDWWSLLPESLHQVTISDRGIPSSFRHMHGFGSHTYSFVNAEGVRHWVKFHHVCQQAIGYLTDSEGVNTLVPGPVETPGLVGLAPPGGKQKLLADMASTIPMGRVGRPDESPPP